MQETVSKAEQAIITFFNEYKTPPQRKMARHQNDVYGCPTTSSSSSTTTPTPTPSCTLRIADPDQGIVAQGCICGSTTLPLLTVSSFTDQAQSCAYTAIPSLSSLEHSPAPARLVPWLAVSRTRLRVLLSMAAQLQRRHRHRRRFVPRASMELTQAVAGSAMV
jgi:hypothetical protein